MVTAFFQPQSKEMNHEHLYHIFHLVHSSTPIYSFILALFITKEPDAGEKRKEAGGEGKMGRERQT